MTFRSSNSLAVAFVVTTAVVAPACSPRQGFSENPPPPAPPVIIPAAGSVTAPVEPAEPAPPAEPVTSLPAAKFGVDVLLADDGRCTQSNIEVACPVVTPTKTLNRVGDGTCMSFSVVEINCPKVPAGEPIPTCNPPPPMRVISTCPDEGARAAPVPASYGPIVQRADGSCFQDRTKSDLKNPNARIEVNCVAAGNIKSPPTKLANGRCVVQVTRSVNCPKPQQVNGKMVHRTCNPPPPITVYVPCPTD